MSSYGSFVVQNNKIPVICRGSRVIVVDSVPSSTSRIYVRQKLSEAVKNINFCIGIEYRIDSDDVPSVVIAVAVRGKIIRDLQDRNVFLHDAASVNVIDIDCMKSRWDIFEMVRILKRAAWQVKAVLVAYDAFGRQQHSNCIVGNKIDDNNFLDGGIIGRQYGQGAGFWTSVDIGYLDGIGSSLIDLYGRSMLSGRPFISIVGRDSLQ